jgi:tetratricopeptide (TPR) repeat protein
MTPSDHSDLRARELLAGQLLASEPERAIVVLRQLHRLGHGLGDRRRSVSALVMIGVAYRLLKKRTRALRILRLAASQAPDWYLPHAELAMQHEEMADHALAVGEYAAARREYATAADLHRKAITISESSGDAAVELVSDLCEREAWCRGQIAATPEREK